MAQTIKLKRSAQSGASGIPSTSDLALGEVGINTYHGKMYIKKDDGTESIVDVGGLPLSGGTLTGNLSLGDNVKLQLGNQTNGDLQIYHDGSNSYIQSATGNFNLTTAGGNEFALTAVNDGAVTLFHNGSAKIATTSTGTLTTGDVVNTGGLYSNVNNSLKIIGGGNASNAGSNLTLYGGTNASAGTFRFRNGTSVLTTITPTGIDVTGSVTADGLTISGTGSLDGFTISSTAFAGMNIQAGASSLAAIDFGDSADSNIGGINYNNANDTLNLRSGNLNRLTAASNGDISFYDSAGTSQNLFWDSSTSRLGLGTTSLTHTLHVTGSHNEMALFKRSVSGNSEVKIDTTTAGDAKLTFANNGTSEYTMGRDNSDGAFKIADGGTIGSNDRLTINADGSSVFSGSVTSTGLDVNGYTYIRKTADNNARLHIIGGRDYMFTSLSNGTLGIYDNTASSYRLTIDASGNTNIPNGSLMVGATTAPNTTLHLSGLTGSPPKLTLEEGGAESRIYATKNSPTNSDLRFQTEISGTIADRMLIDYSGNATFSGAVTADSLIVGGSVAQAKAGVQVSTSSAISTDALASVNDGHFSIWNTNSSATYSGLHFRTRSSSSTNALISLDYNTSFNDGELAFRVRNGSGSNDKMLSLRANSGATFSGSVSTGNMTLSGQEIDVSSGDLTLDVAGNINLDADGGQVVLKDGGTQYGNFLMNNSGDLSLHVETQDKDIKFSGNDNGSPITALTLDMSNAGAATFNSTVTTNKLTLTKDPVGTYSIEVDGTNTGQPNLIVKQSTSERFRCDNSGNLLVGKTSSGLANSGFEVGQSGQINVTQAGAVVARFNRKTSDGSILELTKDGTTVGSIGTYASRLYIGNSDTSLTFEGAADKIYPATSTGAGRDNAIDLGGSSSRFKDLYLSNKVYAAYIGASSDTDTSINFDTANTIKMFTGGQEAARIDASQNLLVGKTVTSLATAGIALMSNDQVRVTTASDNPIELNRLSNDGDIIRFYKDTAQVGSISIIGGNNLTISGTQTNHCGLSFATNAILPATQGATNTGIVDLGVSSEKFKDLYLSGTANVQYAGATDTGIYFNGSFNAVVPYRPDTGVAVDDYLDLGVYSHRWDDIFATNGTIQTSDRNEKQDIESLTEAEERVAVAAKGLLKKFRWKSAVEDKGDDARIHFGIIAQDLQDAFEAEGLDAGRYGMFTSNTWTNEDGEEQTRMGVRYSELLAFIISAI